MCCFFCYLKLIGDTSTNTTWLADWEVSTLVSLHPAVLGGCVMVRAAGPQEIDTLNPDVVVFVLFFSDGLLRCCLV